MNKKKWYEYLWLWSVVYLLLGSVNILFAWLGMIDFAVPLLFAVFGGNKLFCNRYCGKGQLLEKVGSSCGCSRYHATPDILTAKRFRYGFLCFFMGMFGIMLWKTYLVAVGADSLSKTVTLLWTFHLPWDFAYAGALVPEWISQYAFGFYSIMLTSTVIGLAVMALYKPRSWCAFCPMGTLTQVICKLKMR